MEIQFSVIFIFYLFWTFPLYVGYRSHILKGRNCTIKWAKQVLHYNNKNVDTKYSAHELFIIYLCWIDKFSVPLFQLWFYEKWILNRFNTMNNWLNSGPLKLVYPRHFLLKCLNQARNVSGDVYMCYGY